MLKYLYNLIYKYILKFIFITGTVPATSIAPLVDIPPTDSEPDPVAAAHLQHELTIVHGLGDVKAPLKGRSNDFNLSFQSSKKETITNI